MSDIVVIHREQRITVEPVSQVVAVLDIGRQGPQGFSADEVQVPRSKIFASGAAQSIPHGGAVTAVNFNNEDYDYGGLYTGASPTRLTVPVAGLYTGGCCIRFATSTVGLRVVRILKNGAVGLNSFAGPPASDGLCEVTIPFEDEMAAGDYIQTVIYQSSGAALGLDNTLSPTAQAMWMRKSGPLVP